VKWIVQTFREGGVPVNRFIASGGLPAKSPLLMQIYADVLGREIAVGASKQAPALGAAMHGAVAAGEYGSITDASRRMARASTELFRPTPDAHATYNQLYTEYVRLHDLFGRGGDQAMRTLKRLQAQAVAT